MTKVATVVVTIAGTGAGVGSLQNCSTDRSD